MYSLSTTSKSPTVPVMSGDSQLSRRSSEESKQLLINTCIELLAHLPVIEVTNRLLEEKSGLNRSYITRYFGSQDGLFFAASSELERRISAYVPPTGPLDLALVSRRPEVRIRLKLSYWLLAHGHSPSLLLGSESNVPRQLRERLEEMLPTNQRALDAVSMHVFLVAAAVGSYREALELSDESINDLQALEQYLVLNSAKIIADLGW